MATGTTSNTSSIRSIKWDPVGDTQTADVGFTKGTMVGATTHEHLRSMRASWEPSRCCHRD